MRTLTATLEAAQPQPSPRPYVEAVFSDYYGDVSRLRFSRHYSGSEGEYFSAVVIAGDGSLNRARIDPTTKLLYSQRVASPGPTSDFSQWSSHGAVSASGAVALAASGASVFLFYVDADTVTLKQKESTDNGATYGSASTVATAASAVGYLAAASADDGDRVLLWTVGAVVWSSRHGGSSWATPAAWTNTAASLTGIACTYFVDLNVIVGGTEPTSLDAKVWTTMYGDGGFQTVDTWSSLKEATTANANSNVTFLSPALEFLQHWRLFFVEKYTGSVAYARLQWSTMNNSADLKQELWCEPAAFDYTGDYGVSAASGRRPRLADRAGRRLVRHLALRPRPRRHGRHPRGHGRDRRVRRSRSPHPAQRPVRDLRRGRSLQQLRQRAASAPCGAAPASGSPPATTRPSATRPSTGTAYWVESVEQVSGARASLVVQARDAWWLLDRWRARRQFVWAAGSRSISQIIEFLCARAGLDFGAIVPSPSFSALRPAFTVHPGESGRTAVRRLLATVPDEAIMQSGLCIALEPRTSQSVDYTYGTDHAIVAGRYRDEGPDVNRARVFGASDFDEAFDFPEIDSLGERIVQVLDLNLTTTAEVGDRADAALRGVQVRDRGDELLLAGVNCGQELYDVVDLTDAQAGPERRQAPRPQPELTLFHRTAAPLRHDAAPRQPLSG